MAHNMKLEDTRREKAVRDCIEKKRIRDVPGFKNGQACAFPSYETIYRYALVQHPESKGDLMLYEERTNVTTNKTIIVMHPGYSIPKSHFQPDVPVQLSTEILPEGAELKNG